MEAKLIDVMGTDLSVVNAARVSFNKESFYNFSEGFADLEERDSKLIKYLANHNHFTPFTHCTITMRERVPIFVARQRFKHVIGFSYNEISRRYVSYKAENIHTYRVAQGCFKQEARVIRRNRRYQP